jgi:hypothetical protein
MPSNPKTNEQKMDTMSNGWESLTPTKTFGGMTLDHFKAVIAPAKSARARLADLETQMTQALNDRDAADAVFLAKAQQVVNGVLADPTEGPDSSLYEAMGYTRKSERRSGLTRKGNNAPTGSSPPTP